MDRQQVNLRLERELLQELDQMARAERLDRTEMARRILDEGIARHREARALQDYVEGRVSAWGAADAARIPLYDMLDRIHARGVVHDLDPEVLEAIRRATDEEAGGGPGTSTGNSSGNGPAGERARVVAERAVPYGSDAASGVDELRARYRPGTVRTLFVGESSPAGGTHFYRANSNLFRAVREAFAAAFAPASVPDGDAFLASFADGGNWLVDLADAPVNRLDAGARRLAVEAGIGALRSTIAETGPERIIAIKSSVGHAVRRAAQEAGTTATVHVLPFPVRQWRATFVSGLAGILGGDAGAGGRGGIVGGAAMAQRADEDMPVLAQRITRADLARGQLRIPCTGRAKSFFPAARGKIPVLLRGHAFTAGYDPHYDPDQERSGVLRIGRALASLVEAEDRLTIGRGPHETVTLD